MSTQSRLTKSTRSTSSPEKVQESSITNSAVSDVFRDHISELARLATVCATSCANSVTTASSIIAEALANGNKVLACGNGGSAADAQHFVAEFIGRFLKERRPLAAVSLTCDPSIITAVGNDYGFEEVFARQIEALGRPGDVLVAISTSGRSHNVIRAAEFASRLEMKVISLTGANADAVLKHSDAWCRVDSSVTSHIQEIHTAILHSICLGAELLLDF